MRNPLPLSAGAVWRGSQTSGKSRYDVEVHICGVDDRGDFSGTLTIRNLTPSLPKLVTYVDGEVIGEHHSFRTGKWDATQDDDDAHWGRFKRDMYLQGYSGFSRSDMPEDVVFLRLKERAIISPTCERDVSGASFAGFYYIAVQLNPASAPSGTCTPASPTSMSRSASASRLHQLLSQSAPFDSQHRSRAPILSRTESYASVVRGRAASGVLAAAAASGTSSLKQDDSSTAPVAIPATQSFSVPEDEFPLPTAPRSLPFIWDPSRARDLTPSLAPRLPCVGIPRFPRNLNTKTGYRGPWAQAVMRGFYFASSADPYQELELHYVGDGMGLQLEENAEDGGGVDAWGFFKPIDERGFIKRDFMRREAYARPKASASFSLL